MLPQIKVRGSGTKNSQKEVSVDDEQMIARVKEDPSNLNLPKALELSEETHQVLVQVLVNPQRFKRKILTRANQFTQFNCMTTISFTDEDLQL